LKQKFEHIVSRQRTERKRVGETCSLGKRNQSLFNYYITSNIINEMVVHCLVILTIIVSVKSPLLKSFLEIQSTHRGLYLEK